MKSFKNVVMFMALFIGYGSSVVTDDPSHNVSGDRVAQYTLRRTDSERIEDLKRYLKENIQKAQMPESQEENNLKIIDGIFQHHNFGNVNDAYLTHFRVLLQNAGVSYDNKLFTAAKNEENKRLRERLKREQEEREAEEERQHDMDDDMRRDYEEEFGEADW